MFCHAPAYYLRVNECYLHKIKKINKLYNRRTRNRTLYTDNNNMQIRNDELLLTFYSIQTNTHFKSII